MPVFSNIPPVEAEYHLTVVPSIPGDALSVTVPVPQRELTFPVGEAGAALIVAVTGTRDDVLSQVVEVLYELM